MKIARQLFFDNDGISWTVGQFCGSCDSRSSFETIVEAGLRDILSVNDESNENNQQFKFIFVSHLISCKINQRLYSNTITM